MAPGAGADLVRGESFWPAQTQQTFVEIGADGKFIAGGTLVALHRLARMRIAGVRFFPGPLNALLRPILRQVPLRLALFRNALLSADSPQAVRRLLHHSVRAAGFGSFVLVVLDRRDPVWSIVARHPGVTLPLSIMARSEEPIDHSRPWSLG